MVLVLSGDTWLFSTSRIYPTSDKLISLPFYWVLPEPWVVTLAGHHSRSRITRGPIHTRNQCHEVRSLHAVRMRNPKRDSRVWTQTSEPNTPCLCRSRGGGTGTTTVHPDLFRCDSVEEYFVTSEPDPVLLQYPGPVEDPNDPGGGGRWSGSANYWASRGIDFFTHDRGSTYGN